MCVWGWEREGRGGGLCFQRIIGNKHYIDLISSQQSWWRRVQSFLAWLVLRGSLHALYAYFSEAIDPVMWNGHLINTLPQQFRLFCQRACLCVPALSLALFSAVSSTWPAQDPCKRGFAVLDNMINSDVMDSRGVARAGYRYNYLLSKTRSRNARIVAPRTINNGSTKRLGRCRMIHVQEKWQFSWKAENTKGGTEWCMFRKNASLFLVVFVQVTQVFFCAESDTTSIVETVQQHRDLK